MNATLRFLIASLLATAAVAASAHEFWMLPDRSTAPAGSTVRFSLGVGENFAGDTVGFSRPLVASLRHYTASGVTDLATRVAPTPTADFPLVLAAPGAHLLALDTHPSEIVLEAGRFEAYLHEEGLDFIIAARAAAGQTGVAGRERYRRNIKALVQAGGRSDRTALQKTGQRLELVPVADPLRHARGSDLRFQVVFDQQPLAGALVKFWHRRGDQTLIVRTRSNAQGQVTVTPPWPGSWMASVVHMIAVTDSPAHDWDSYWGNLSFTLP